MCHRVDDEMRQHLSEGAGVTVHRQVMFAVRIDGNGLRMRISREMRQHLFSQQAWIEFATCRLTLIERDLFERLNSFGRSSQIFHQLRRRILYEIEERIQARSSQVPARSFR